MNKQGFCGLALGVVLLGMPTTMFAQESKPKTPEPAVPMPVKPLPVKVVYEVFTLPLSEAAALQRAGLADTEFYGRLLAGLKEEKVKLESFLTVRGISGQSMVTSQAEEYTYPLEFEPPELPNQVIGASKRKGADGKEVTIFPATPATPAAYKKRILGESLEVEAVVKESGQVDLRVAPVRTVLIQKDSYGQGLSKVEMPRFSVPEIRTAVETQSGQAFYLGTVSAPAELQPEEGPELVSFAFITATDLSNEPSITK
ncbi:MAG: hypothetical protein ABF380_01680 [Akkermansiaceae bacterium]